MTESARELDAIVADARRRHRAGALDAADALYDSVLARNPDHVEALHLKGVLRAQKGARAEGLSLVTRACAQAPDDPRIRANLAKIRLDSGDVAGAVEDYEAALARAPEDADLRFNAAGALAASGRLEDAIAHLEYARGIAPDHARALANLGNLHRLAGRLDESRRILGQACEAMPDDSGVQHSFGATLMSARDYAGAIERFRRALELDRGFVDAAAQLFHASLCVCDWKGAARLAENFRRLADDGGPLGAVSPPVALFLPFGQARLNAVSDARAAILRRRAGDPGPGPAPDGPGPQARLRIGYLSAGFGDRRVGRLVADLFRRHDRAAFEVTGFALSPPDGSDVQRAIHDGLDRVEDLARASAGEAVERIRGSGTDVLIDLDGFAAGARPEILAARVAPLQIGWLGYCGSSGGLNDVLLTDENAVPAAAVPDFREAVAHLPGSFMPLGRFDAPDEEAGPRADHGLPEDGFVFCAFGAPAKIDGGAFAAWMDILERTPDSVLWLREHAPLTARNLRAAAEARGIAPDRLVFAPPLERMSAHLARLRHAGLFLDSFVYGAHSAAADAVSLGLPVLTLAGPAMPARVGASLCRAHRIGETVAGDPESYVGTAVALAKDPGRLADLSARLRASAGEEDAGNAFAAKLERAYRLLREARQAGRLGPGTLIRVEKGSAGAA